MAAEPTPSRPAPPAAAPEPGEPLWPSVAPMVALVTGVLSVLLAIMMWVAWFQASRQDPLTSTTLAALKTALAKDPADDALKRQIRELDLRLRQSKARHLQRATVGAWCLLGTGTLALFSLQTVFWRRGRLNCPPKQVKTSGTDQRLATQATYAVLVFGAGVAGVGWWLAHSAETHLDAKLAKALNDAPSGAQTNATEASSKAAAAPSAQPVAAPAPPGTPFPSGEELARQWPRFRGPTGMGIATFTNVPSTWEVASGQNVAWKSPVPYADYGSVVVWEDRAFLTGGNANKREVLCFSVADGKLLWQKPVDLGTAPVKLPEASSGYAACTPVVDGRRVYAMFANGDVAAFDLAGNPVWARNLGIPANMYGHGVSLALYRDRLLVQYDQGEVKEAKSKLLALETATGKPAWESAVRPVPHSWSTPIVVQAAQKEQIITCANPWVIAYEAGTGTELWRAKVLGGDVTPSPVFANGLVFTAMEGAQLSAIKPDGSGDVSKTHIAWIGEEGLPDICSPLTDGQRVYLLSTYGNLTCYSMAEGKKLWEKELESEFKTSPTLVGDRIYLWDDKGTAFMVAAGNEFKELGRVSVGEALHSTPAYLDGRILVRTVQSLICLGGKKG